MVRSKTNVGKGNMAGVEDGRGGGEEEELQACVLGNIILGRMDKGSVW